MMTPSVIARSVAPRHDDLSSVALAKEEAIQPFRQAQALSRSRRGPEPVEGLDRHSPTDAGPRDDTRCHASTTRGFTIIEVAMAVIILAMTLTTALTALQRAFLEFDTARNLEIAGNIMQCEIEKERLFTWAAASNASYAPVIDASFTRNPAIAGRFTLSRSLATLASHSAQVVQITLTLTWRSYDGHKVSRSYTTYYTQGGLYAYLYNNP